MDQQPPTSPHLLPTAVVFEGLLGLVAIGLGGILEYPPGQMIAWTWPAVGWGALASLPLLGFLGVLVRYPFWPFRHLLDVVDQLLVPAFRQASLLDLAIIALVAGLSEEALFRGVIQMAIAEGIGGPMGVWIGLAVASLLFGLAHFLTFSYIVMASFMGLYLGWLWIESGNLLVPIATHALYDFLALVYLAKIREPGKVVPRETGQSGRGP